MYQTWSDLLFLHWEIDPAIIQATLPDGLTVDTYDGKAYIGLVPFYMERIRPRFMPSVPGISWFLEYNVRTYVYAKNGTPGVWFYSLDCNQPLAVWTARTFFKLPYFNAQMAATKRKRGRSIRPDTPVGYWSTRDGYEQTSHFSYQKRGNQFFAKPGTLEFFLAERYILFAQTKRGLASGQVYHQPYGLFSAEVTHYDTHALVHNGLPAPLGAPVSALYSPGVTVNVYPLQQIR